MGRKKTGKRRMSARERKKAPAVLFQFPPWFPRKKIWDGEGEVFEKKKRRKLGGGEKDVGKWSHPKELGRGEGNIPFLAYVRCKKG